MKRLAVLLKPYGFYIFLSLVSSAASVVLTLMLPILIGQAVDCLHGLYDVDTAAFKVILYRMGAVIIGSAFFQWILNRINNRVVYNVTADIRKQAYGALSRLPIRDIDAHPHGDYVSRIINDADTVADGLLLGFTQLFSGVLTITGIIVFMIRLDIRIAAIVILLTPVSIFTARFIARGSHDKFLEQAADRSELTDLVSETVSGSRLIRSYDFVKDTTERFDAASERLKESSVKAIFYSSLTNPVTRFINSLVYNGIGIAGAYIAIGGGISVGVLTSFLSYASQYAKPFNEITGVITELQNAFVCAGRLFELIDSKPEDDVKGEASCDKNEDGRSDIAFEDVSFSYDSARPLIEHLNLSVRPGERIAIVGPTGSGKTTLINLIMRFYDVDLGRICVAGRDIREVPRHLHRQRFGMVLQETWLFAGTIRDNIKMAACDATDEEMMEAARHANAHGFISRLPDGYDTVLTKDGGNLSQGQKQLLCIARLMLALPPMLILDEATSSIDTRTEMKIQKAFSDMMTGRTSFIVAHRLGTIRSADRILYMQDGHVLEQGTHDELMSKDGYYAALYKSQFAH